MQGKLTALGVARLKTPGMYGDGYGLWLQVTGKGAKSWIYRFTLAGRSREMGLGSTQTFSLAEARDRARECRKLTADGIDPIEIRKEKRQQTELEAAKSVTFSQCSTAYFEAHKPGWRNATHLKQWPASMEAHVYPIFGELPVAAIDTGLVMKVLEPIWKTKAQTAGRVRGRIESVLDWATTRGYRRGENPARWKGHLQNLLPKQSLIHKVKHHPALPYDQMPEFMADLAKEERIKARLLEFIIFTAARSNEAAGARWSELDLEAAIWTIPAERMKSGVEHRVPLSAPVIALLRGIERTANPLVFRGPQARVRIDNKLLRDLLAKLRTESLTVHGFRSTFRDWVAERTSFSRDLAELALAHTVGGTTERSYWRSDLFEKRRELMDAWAAWCSHSEAAR